MAEWISINDAARLLEVTYQAAGQLVTRKGWETKLVNGRRFVLRADIAKEQALREEVRRWSASRPKRLKGAVMTTKQQTPEQKAATARDKALRDLARHIADVAMPAAQDANIATGGYQPAHGKAWDWLYHLWRVFEACGTLEGFPDPLGEADPDALRQAYIVVAAAACDTTLLSPALMAQWTRALGAARYKCLDDDPVLGFVHAFMVPSESCPGDWRHAVICRTGDSCDCPGHAAHGHCFHCDNARALAVAMGLIPPPVNTTVFVADGETFSTREEAELHLAQTGRRSATVDEVPVADLPSAGDYDRMEAEEMAPCYSLPRPALANSTRVIQRDGATVLQHVAAPIGAKAMRPGHAPQISATFQAGIDDPARVNPDYTVCFGTD